MSVAGSFNLASALVDAHVEAGRGGHAAIRHQGRTLTYAEVEVEVDRCGNALRGLGVGPGDRVALLLPDSPEFIVSFFGAVKIGAVALPLSTLLPGEGLAYMLSDSEATALIADAATLDRPRTFRERLPHLRHVIVVDAATGSEHAYSRLRQGPARTESEPKARESYCALLDAADARLEAAPTTASDMCFWQYSSGTTGRPKAVMHRMRDLWEVAERYGRHVIGMTSADRSFSLAKLYFSYGLGNSLAFPFRYGATVVLHPGRPEPAAVFDLVARERPTLFYAVPTAYAALLAAAEAGAPADLSSVRCCVSAGEPLPKALFERWQRRFGLEIVDGIGSTEVGYIFISNVPGQVRPGTSGRVVPGFGAKVVDEQERPVPSGQVGDLWVKGPSTFAGYWGQPDRTERTIRGGWVVTGDRYSLDPDGYFTYAGRSDDMLRVGAMWVSPIEVESALLEHSSVLECAVVGHADADGLVKPAAYVVLRPGVAGGSALAAEMQASMEARLAPFKRPRWIRFVADLPKTPTGKIQRFRLREMREEVTV
ncbi:MAG: benzoate-CoA ligase family protein [Candidatus Limnocylindria bacterium]